MFGQNTCIGEKVKDLKAQLDRSCTFRVMDPCAWSKFLGGEGVVDGEGVAVKGAWSGVVGGGGVIKGSFQKHLKTGGVKAKVVRRGGGGFEGVTTPAPPENFNHTPVQVYPKIHPKCKLRCEPYLRWNNSNLITNWETILTLNNYIDEMNSKIISKLQMPCPN